jgi:transcriptional regulator/AAA ATPase-like protein
MTVTVRQLIEEQAAGLVGREDERAILHQLLGEGGPLVVFVHGLAGVGKSTLVQAFAVEARERGATVLRLDCRAIEPTERGFLAALASATGAELPTTIDAAARLERLGEQVVLVLDTYEVFRLFDSWLQQRFITTLSDNVRVVLSGREPPMTGWASAFGGLFRSLPLGGLPRDDAGTLLRLAGVDGADAERIDRFARGHPLSLKLAASALQNRPDISIEAVTVQAIVEELTELYLDVLDPVTRQALDAAAVVRRPTLSLLAAMLPNAAPQDAFDRLLGLPFVELSDDGLVLHDTVRETVAAHLRSSDPDRSRRYRAAAWRQLRAEVTRASTHELWRYTADLLYILQNPIVREAFFPTTEHQLSPEFAKASDGPAIAAIMTEWEPPASVAILRAWWRREPGTFRVMRDRQGAVAGFHILAELDHLSHGLLEADPVARRCWEHLRREPVPRGQRVLLNRRWLARDHGEAPSPVQAACWLDVKGRFMELRPHLRRIYSVVQDIATLGPMVAPLGFTPLQGEPTVLDGSPYYAALLDFGPSSIDGWLSSLVAAELRIDEDSILDVAQHQLVLDGRRVDLTSLEFELFNYLHQRPGKVVERASILRDVWGTDYAGGSNVIEVAVGSIRRKLGDRSSAVETVRGMGYRFIQE